MIRKIYKALVVRRAVIAVNKVVNTFYDRQLDNIGILRSEFI